MKTLPVRVFSAVLMLAAITAVYVFFKIPGIIVLGFLFCALGAYEYQKIVFQLLAVSTVIRVWFLLVCVLLIFLTLFSSALLMPLWGVAISVYFSGTLWLLRGKSENNRLLTILSLSGLGFVYCALFPVYALQLLNLKDGEIWFIFLCGVVFFGDIFAYFGGILFGEKKIMPHLSPNKTWAGSLAGLLGSVLVAVIMGQFGLKSISTYSLALVAFVGGLLAQNGDLFESLLKRVAAVKDSGQFMPGHGGVLDRLDGLYFAAPFIYIAALYLGA